LKLAASLDGRTALANGQSQWITGEPARRDVHRWRARSSAVMTGVGTILADDPALTARADDLAIDVLQPVRIIVDSTLRTPPGARTLGLDGEVVIFSGPAGDERREPLLRAGARLQTVPLTPGRDEPQPAAGASSSPTTGAAAGPETCATPRCDLGAVVRQLAALEINDVWLESGPTLAGAMLAQGLVDELVLYLAPCLLGDTARGLVALPELTSLSDRWRLAIDDLRRVGDDLRIVARPVAN
jgi:diaminohydroxyphosphoribosylaminopyrimidine deaminase/5-amino-6-(5-phosphoribosylamino)uracil reductase